MRMSQSVCLSVAPFRCIHSRRRAGENKQKKRTGEVLLPMVEEHHAHGAAVVVVCSFFISVDGQENSMSL